MRSMFLNVPFFKIILLPLFIAPLQAFNKETAHEELAKARSKITVRFDSKIEKREKELFKYAELLKKDPLFQQLEAALTALQHDPIYDFYLNLKESCIFIERLKEHHSYLLEAKLLQDLNALIDRLQRHEQFTSFRATLKKERVALIELAEERDLVTSLEKIITYQGKDLNELCDKERERIAQIPSYLHVKQIQKKYMQASTTKKFIACANQLNDLLLQEEIALLKNRRYQQLLVSYELAGFPAPLKKDSRLNKIKQVSYKLQHDLHTIPVNEML